ncbi:MAG TPA: FKBP-type peptidyl-prolyl cis-trans isomerase, partial [Kofleriaceae bacterium]|nr:FKBP-type peptidyl-prolyl cis-trans isomerase [Kofleriaceae bacterium]
PPPLPVAAPPADAESITGIPDAPGAVVRLVRLVAGSGPKPGRNDLVRLNLDGWRLNGDTFLTTRTRHRPIEQSLAMLAPGFVAAVTTMQKGEKAMVWVPAEVGYYGTPDQPPEPLVYQVELVDFEPAPATPPDVAGPPASATTTPSGLARLVVTKGTGKEHPHVYDGVTYDYTGWTSSGRIFDSSELRKRPKSTPLYREWPGLEEALSAMVVGERDRIWLPRGPAAHGGEPLVEEQAGLPPGKLCLELTLEAIQPGHPLPPAPPAVAAAPADAKTTPAGVRYRVLVPGTGTVHPTARDLVEVEYTGWSASGRPFDSTAIRGEPIKLVVSRAIPGWTDGIEAMTEGETARLWIPEELAFKGAAGEPRGTVVFDLKLVHILPAPPPPPARAEPPTGFAGQPPGGPPGGSPKTP